MSREESLRNNARAHEVVAELQAQGMIAIDADSHEVFLVLKRAFASASKDAKRRVRSHVADRLVEIKVALGRQRYETALTVMDSVLRDTTMGGMPRGRHSKEDDDDDDNDEGSEGDDDNDEGSEGDDDDSDE